MGEYDSKSASQRREPEAKGESPLSGAAFSPAPDPIRLEFPPPSGTLFGDTENLARALFPGDRDASHALAMAGVLGISRFIMSSWLDGLVPDSVFTHGYTEFEAELRQTDPARLKSFLARNSARLTALDEFLHGPADSPASGLSDDQLLLLSSLLRINHELLRGVAFTSLATEPRTAVELARRVDPELLGEWRSFTRYLLKHGVDEVTAANPVEIAPERLMKWYAHPWTHSFPTLSRVNLLGEVVVNSKLLADTGMLRPLIMAARDLTSRDAIELFFATTARVATALTDLTKDLTNAPRVLSSLVKDLPPGDALTVVEILAGDPVAATMSRRLESYGVHRTEIRFGSWLINHRAWSVETPAGSKSLAEHLVELAGARPGARPTIITFMSYTDEFVAANLLTPTLALLQSSLDPSLARNRLRAAGAALRAGVPPEEACALLESQARPAPVVSPPPTSGSRPARPTPPRELLQERLSEYPDLARWVTHVFEVSEEQAPLLRSLRRLSALPSGHTLRLATFLRDFADSSRLEEFITSPAAFDRLAEFLLSGRHEDLRSLTGWLRGETSDDPPFLCHLRGLNPAVGASSAKEAEVGEPSGFAERLTVPSGNHRRLVVIGGIYTPPKQAAINEAAGGIPVLFLSPDESPRTFRQTLNPNDLVVINTNWNSHAAFEAVINHCRGRGIPRMIVPHSGYKAIVHIAEQLQR